jgi:hypothetical protein
MSPSLDRQPGLLLDLPVQRSERVLCLVQETAGQIPTPDVRLERAPAEQHAAVLINDHGLRAGNRIAVREETAGRAIDPVARERERRGAAGAILPVVEKSHDLTI